MNNKKNISEKGTKMKKLVMLNALLAAAAVFAQEESINLSKKAAWDASTKKYITVLEGAITCEKMIFMTQMQSIKIDPSKTYTVSFSASSDGEKGSAVRIGFKCFTADNKIISSQNALIQPKTDTVLTADAKKGDTVLHIKDGSGWKNWSFLVLAFNTKPDLSDLPNFDTAVCRVAGIEKKGGSWMITLKQPLPKDLPAGTGIRQHLQSSMFFAGKAISAGKDPVPVTASVKGIGNGLFGPDKWPAGTDHVITVLFVNPNGKAKTVLKDVKLTIQ